MPRKKKTPGATKRSARSTKRTTKRNITAEDLLRLKFVDGIAMSPNENQIAINVRVVAENRKKYFSHIWMVNTDGTNLRQFTNGEVTDGVPVFSPDGELLAFTSKRNDKKGIYLMPSNGGEPKLLIEGDGSYSNLSFSPDGKSLLYVFRKNDEVPRDEKGNKEEPVFRHITRLFYKLDNLGFLPQDEGQIYTCDVETGKEVKVSSGTRGKMQPVWSPDGKQIAYLCNIQRNPDIDVDLIDLFVIPAKGGKARRIDTPRGPKMMPRFSPNGKEIAYIGHDDPNDAWGVKNMHVWKVPVRGGKAVNLTANLDRQCLDLTISDTVEAHDGGLLHWSHDGKTIFFVVSDAGATHIYKMSSNGRNRQKVVGGKLHVMGAALNGKTNSIAAVVTNTTTPAEVYITSTAAGGRLQQVTRFNSWLQKEVHLVKPEELILESTENYPVHAWIMKPPGFRSGKKYPSILQVHGGPRVQYGFSFFHEMQYLAAQGYVVFYSNPRGGQGYGEKHAAPIVAAWGTYDYDDCMAFADYMETLPYIDKKRMGVTGGSYGGFMTNWIVGHTHRFKAGVTQRSCVNFESMYGSSDIGVLLPREIGNTPYNNQTGYRKQSPLTYVKNIKTPLLIIHSEQDLRCPIEQAEQLFMSLKMMGRTTEFVRFPQEPHGLSRCGRPDRRLARLDWIRKWFDRYLKGKRK